MGSGVTGICRHRGFVLLMMGVLCLGGCSIEQWYEAGRNRQRLDCEKLAEVLLRQTCLRDANTDFDHYKRETEKLKP